MCVCGLTDLLGNSVQFVIDMKLQEEINHLLEWSWVPSEGDWHVQATSTEVSYLQDLKTRLEDIDKRKTDHSLKLQYRIVKETKIREILNS